MRTAWICTSIHEVTLLLARVPTNTNKQVLNLNLHRELTRLTKLTTKTESHLVRLVWTATSFVSQLKTNHRPHTPTAAMTENTPVEESAWSRPDDVTTQRHAPHEKVQNVHKTN